MESIKIIKVPEKRLLFFLPERRGRDSIKITQVAPEINTAAGVHLGKANMTIRYRMSKNLFDVWCLQIDKSECRKEVRGAGSW